MIKGFENITHELTDRELEAMVLIAERIKLRIGKEQAVTNATICKGMANVGFKLVPARVRKIIHHIRLCGMVQRLMSTSKGYYVANDPQELRSYIKSLNQRIQSIQEIEKAMSKQFHNYYSPELFKK